MADMASTHPTPGQLVRKAREAHGLTIFQLAVQVGLDPSTISRMERGQRPIGPDSRIALAARLGLDAEQLATPNQLTTAASS